MLLTSLRFVHLFCWVEVMFPVLTSACGLLWVSHLGGWRRDEVEFCRALRDSCFIEGSLSSPFAQKVCQKRNDQCAKYATEPDGTSLQTL